ncbi:AMP-binding enzyme C-terminal domain protein [Kalmanozyma brasiliensis GHG001]|uniref:4-coumarate-CoA ligase 2 n=1 Tax=Kalmanozyma brasiliensis (strain GHG001) TaxID=1365824 RepID=V5F3P7_KALBG|nr:AMP-binding enzyme C-terminal domain protein [Kalmanozyma brasiliensis GHG001]EST10174.1 AMP-binding enzyme C-terminal domain protein [Kalmanozyma brasiliensis GHG001]
MSSNSSASGSGPAAKRSILEDFKGDRDQQGLVPLDKVDQLLTQKGSLLETEVRFIHGRLTTVWKHLPDSVRDAWMFAANEYASRPYIVAEGESLTYAEVHKRVVLTATWLSHHLSVRKGDRVALVARNHVEFVIGFYAIHLLGAVPALVNAFLPGKGIYDCIRDVGCKVALLDVERFRRLRDADEDYIAKLFTQAGKDCVDDFGCTPGAHGGLAGVVVFPRAFAGIVPEGEREWAKGKGGDKVFDASELDTKYASTASTDKAIPKIKISPEDMASVLYTSGTTGKPKGVAATNRQFLSAGPNSSYNMARAYVRRGLQPPQPQPDDEQASTILLIPLFHSTGIQSGLVPSTLRGVKVALMPKYDVDAAAKIIQEHKIQIVVGIGFMVREIVLSKHELPSLQGVSHGGSSSAKELPEESRAKVPSMLIGQGYGSTEVNGGASGLAADDYIARPTSAGRAVATNEIHIIDPETLVEVSNGKPGEIWIRGPNTALGYWGKPEATAEAFTPDGYFRTGDLGRKEDDGFIYVMDRSKHIIIRGGENISGTEVETAIYAERRIIDCAAVPIPDDRFGETVGVVCVPRVEYQKENRPTEEDVLKVARKFLPKHEVPDFIWIRDEPLERNANGKVDKAIVKEAARKRHAEGKAASAKPKL